MARRERNEEVLNEQVQEQDLQQEMEGGAEADLTAPTPEEAAAEAKDTRVWHNAEGQEVSKSEFIREQFTKNNLSRKQISEQFNINYRTVYGATVNMVNEAEPATRGRSASATKILVSAAGEVITSIEGVVHLDNVAVEDAVGAAAQEGAVEVDRNTWIKEQVEAGRERGKVAAALGLSYGVVYSLTKEVEGASQRHEMEIDGEIVSRSEYIRRRYAAGVSKSEIAKELGVDYPVVWSALKALKSEDAKYADAVDRLAKFADKVTDVDAFNSLIAMLREVTIKEDAEPAPAEEAAATTETPEVTE